MTISQKYALVTGGTSGIGYQISKLLAKDGYHLIIVARNEEELFQTASEFENEFSIKVITVAKDLFQKNAAFELHNFVKAKGLQVDILVNDAGQGQYGEFINTDIHREIDIIQLNIISLVVLTKEFLKEMVARGKGRILNLSSIAGKVPGPLQSVYHGTKAFVQSFTEAIREEVKGTGVTVTALLPGATDTDFFNKADMLDAKIVAEGKLDDPEKVAKDGYEALMSGDDKIISGFKNKAQVAMANVMPDSVVAANMHKQQQPVNSEHDYKF